MEALVSGAARCSPPAVAAVLSPDQECDSLLSSLGGANVRDLAGTLDAQGGSDYDPHRFIIAT
jgi:hypothetical protein